MMAETMHEAVGETGEDRPRRARGTNRLGW